MPDNKNEAAMNIRSRGVRYAKLDLKDTKSEHATPLRNAMTLCVVEAHAETGRSSTSHADTTLGTRARQAHLTDDLCGTDENFLV